ncbi:MAG: hypothetical protein PHC28_07860 [Flavobacterium sp.]|nr:hypothetical protein [Flavobacterium sp.]
MSEKEVFSKLNQIGKVEISVERENIKMMTVMFKEQQKNIAQGVEVLRFVSTHIDNVIMGAINPESVSFSIKKIVAASPDLIDNGPRVA